MIDCVGSRSSLNLALRTARAGGRVVVSGIPTEGADLTLRFRELELVGAYTGGTRPRHGQGQERKHAFEIATDLALEPARRHRRGDVLALPLARGDHALGAGKLGTLKVAFDPRMDWPSDTRHDMARPGFVLEVDERTRRSSSTRARGSGAEVPDGNARDLPAGLAAEDPGPATTSGSSSSTRTTRSRFSSSSPA